MINGALVVTNGTAPACTVDDLQHVYLRGHVTLHSVAAVGGQLLELLPLTGNGLDCPCSPGNITNPTIIFATTTGLAVPFDAFRPSIVPDVCIIRLQISRQLRIDVDLNGIIDINDMMLITSSPLFIMSPSVFCNVNCGRLGKQRHRRCSDCALTLATQT